MKRPLPLQPEPSKSVSKMVLCCTLSNFSNFCSESLEPNGTLDRKASAEEDFPQLREWFEDTEAGYIIYFLDTPSDSYFFISYVPETSNVRGPPPQNRIINK